MYKFFKDIEVFKEGKHLPIGSCEAEKNSKFSDYILLKHFI